jgi:hypothetical protein
MQHGCKFSLRLSLSTPLSLSPSLYILTVLEKRTQRRKRDQTMLYFTVVRGVLHSGQAEMQAAPGLGVRSFCGVGSQGAIKGLKRSILVISDSCALQAVRKR